MWKKKETYLVLEGVRTRATTVQISVKVPQKTKNRNITWPSHTALEHTVLECYTTLHKLLQLRILTKLSHDQLYQLLLESSWHRNACSSIFMAALLTGD